MQMDWISLLQAQQIDFLHRVKKPKTTDVSLLENQVKGCHSEIMAFCGDSLTKIIEGSRQKAEILAKNPPPIPPEYPESSNWTIPFSKYFQRQAEYYLVREQIVDRMITERLHKLLKKVPQNTLENMLLDDEGNLHHQSKFIYYLTNNPQISVQVHVADGESFNGIKKDKIRWTITQDDVKNHHVLIFLCLFYPGNSKIADQRQTVITGFLPTNQLEFIDPQIHVTPSKLLYAGGLNWYLQSLHPENHLSGKDENITGEIIETVPSDHYLKPIIGDWECWQTLSGHTRGINCLAYTIKTVIDESSGWQNVKYLPILASGSRGETKLWDLSKGELITTFSEYHWSMSGIVDEINSLAFSDDGQILITVGADSTVKMWHTGALDLIDIWHKHHGNVRCVGFSPDGKMVMTGGDDRRILFWNLRDRLVQNILSLDDTAAHSMVLSTDGKILITGSYRKIKVWDISSFINHKNCCECEPVYNLMGHSHIVNSLVISDDTKYLISGSRDKTVRIWNLATGELIHILKGHEDIVNTVALSPDQEIIASGSADKTIKIWHLHTGELLATFTGHSNSVTAVTFTTSGEMLVSASLDKTIKIWQRS